MASDGAQGSVDANIIRIYGQLTNNVFINLAIITLTAYDYFLTVDDEREYVWKQKFSGATFIFFVNRYLLIACVIIVASTLMPFQTDQSCDALHWVSSAVVWVLQMVHAVFVSLRLYAIWSRSLAAGISTFVLFCIPLVLRIYSDAQASHGLSARVLTEGMITGCIMTTNKSTGITGVLVAANGTMIVAQTWTLVLTWLKTYSLKREANAMNVSVPIASLLLRDGSVQFLAITTLDILQTIWMLVRSSDLLHPLVACLSSILVSHFILNLRQVHLSGSTNHALGSLRFTIPPSAINTSTASSMSSVHFASNIIANLGAPLRYTSGGTEDSMISEEERISPVVSRNPLAVVLTGGVVGRNGTIVKRGGGGNEGGEDDEEKLLMDAKSGDDGDLELEQVFEDLTYGHNLLDVIRRKGTQDTTQQASPASIKPPGPLPLPVVGSDAERQPLVSRVDEGEDGSESGSESDGTIGDSDTYGHV